MRSRSPSKSPIPVKDARLMPAACTRVSAGRSAKRGARARWFNSKGRSGQRFRNSRRAALSARPRVRSRFPAAICRSPTPCSPTTRFASSIARAGRSPSSTPRGRRSRWSTKASSTRRCGRGRAHRSYASRHGPATAIRKGSREICSTSLACGCLSREGAPATKRASSSGPSEAEGNVCARTIHD